MEEVIHNALGYLWDIAKLGIVMWGILGFPKKFSKKGTLALFAVMLVCNIMANRISMIKIRSAVMIVISIMAVLLNMKSWRQAFLCIPVYFLITLLDFITIVLLLEVMGKVPSDIVLTESSTERGMQLISNSIIFLVYFCFWHFVGKKRNRKLHLPDAEISLLSAAMVFVFIEGFMCMVKFGTGDGKASHQELALIGSLFAGIAFLLVVCYLFYIKNKNARYEEQVRFSQNSLEYQKKYYESLLEKEQETKRFRHDVRAHLNCVLGLLQEEKTEEARKYLEEIRETAGGLQKKDDTGNHILDFVVAHIMEEHKGLSICWKGAFPEKVYIAAPDLCVLCSNLLKNSFEAQKRYEKETGQKKTVNVFVKNWGKDLFFSVENNIPPEEIFQGAVGKTRKPDREHHGYGLYNIEEIVKKYHGNIEYQQEMERVIVEIYFENILEE